MRGDGRIYTQPKSPFFWMAYCYHGREIRESSGILVSEENRAKAEKKLREKRDEIIGEKHGGSPFLTPEKRKINVDDIFDFLEQEYVRQEIATPQFRSTLKHIRAALGWRRAVDLVQEPAPILDYINKCRKAGTAKATINRRLQLLTQAYKLAMEHRKLTAAPYIPKFKEENARSGYFEHGDFNAVVEHLPAYLQDFTRFAYMTGWRKGEIGSLCWGDAEWKDGKPQVIHLRAENAKNGTARSLALYDERGALTEIGELIERRRAARTVEIEDEPPQFAAYIFHREGSPIGDTRKSWATACDKAGLVGKLFHDLRRTAVRNMVRAGTPEKVAMDITGHKTRSMFDRYNIVNEDQKQLALSLTQRWVVSTAEERKVQVMRKPPAVAGAASGEKKSTG